MTLEDELASFLPMPGDRLTPALRDRSDIQAVLERLGWRLNTRDRWGYTDVCENCDGDGIGHNRACLSCAGSGWTVDYGRGKEPYDYPRK